MADNNFHKLALSESFERVAKVAEERDAFNEQMKLRAALEARGLEIRWAGDKGEGAVTHHSECEDATGEYPGSCTCAIIKRREAMDNLIAQDADLIDTNDKDSAVLLPCPNCEATKQELSDFRQEVSDAVEGALLDAEDGATIRNNLSQFIIPKPDPLVDVAKMMGYFNTAAKHWASDVRAALEARGLEIGEKSDD